MKKIILLLVSGFFLFLSCNTSETVPEQIAYPECLKAKIQMITNNPPANPRATIKKFTYQNETVYKVETYYPDGKSEIYNQKCELVCTDGGINGSTTCINWNSASFLETVWTDPR